MPFAYSFSISSYLPPLFSCSTLITGGPDRDSDVGQAGPGAPTQIAAGTDSDPDPDQAGADSDQAGDVQAPIIPPPPVRVLP